MPAAQTLRKTTAAATLRRRQQPDAILEQSDEIRVAERERERLASEVERERQRLLSIVSNVPGVVWEAWGEPDRESQFTDFVSDHVTRMFGYSVEEWLSTPNFRLTIVYPDDRELAARNAHEHFVSGGSRTNTFRWMTKDGRAIWVEAHSTVVSDASGKPIGMRGVTFDISARKRAEESLRMLAQASEILSSSLELRDRDPGGGAARDHAARRLVRGQLHRQGRRLAARRVAHRDPAKDGMRSGLLTQFPPRRDLPPKVIESINLRRPTILNATRRGVRRPRRPPAGTRGARSGPRLRIDAGRPDGGARAFRSARSHVRIRATGPFDHAMPTSPS